MADPTHGHVALVAKINADGSIVVEESNWTNPNRYGTHTVSASQVKKLTYAHTEVGWH
jgi:surface antigen